MTASQTDLLQPDAPAVRFWNFVRRGPECWEWQGSRSGGGYGRFRFQSRYENAHRVAWMLSFGPIPKGIQVCHKCDNPPCVRPDHLFLGTCQENARDSVRKQRHPVAVHPHIVRRGERSNFSKLTDAKVLEIRQLARTGLMQKTIAARFGISKNAMSAIVNRKTWAHLPEDV